MGGNLTTTRRRIGRGVVGIAAAALLAVAVPVTGHAEGSSEGTAGSSDIDLGSLAEVDWVGLIDALPVDAIEIGTQVIEGDRNPQDLLNVLDVTGSLAPEQQCNATTKAGGQVGVQNDRYNLGKAGPSTIELKYQTYSIPDKIAVKTGAGKELWSTDGYVSTNGKKTQLIDVPEGVSTVVVMVTADKQGTEWEYSLSCPL